MTDETFHKLMVRWLAAQGELEPADWSREAREKVEQAGLVAGDKLGNKRYKSLLTREEAAVMLARLLELLER